MANIKRTEMRNVVIVLLLMSVAATGHSAAVEETRQSVTTQMPKAERERGTAGRVSKDEFKALRTQGSRQSRVSGLAAGNGDFWFYSADVVLFNDHDGDGHFHGIDLLFDADTYYLEADVYAVVYLSLADGPWNEYSVTDNFTLYGTAAEDAYGIVTELVSGYPTGSYDLLIELFDAWDDSFLASFGPADTSALAFLPLEDEGRDTPYTPPTTVIVNEGGGSLDWLLLLALLCALPVLRRHSHES